MQDWGRLDSDLHTHSTPAVPSDSNSTLLSIHRKPAPLPRQAQVSITLSREPLVARASRFLEPIHRGLDIRNQDITATAREVVTADNPQKSELGSVCRHCIRGHKPATCTKLVGQCEFVKAVLVLGIEAKCDQR